ncbi:MAG: DUF4173 domain-containing protein [Oscillibacter sp.]|nr:DUF4173 domain-containing protein [Oscillibacter sp.]
MAESNNVMPRQPAVPQEQPLIPQREPWEAGDGERRLVRLSLALSLMGVSFLRDWSWRVLPGLGITALTAAWYAVLFLYRGTDGMKRRVNQVLMGAVALLALTFTLFSNQWFRFWNCGALVLLIAVHTWELCGGGQLAWDRAGMLFERLWLLGKGPFVRCGALVDTLRAEKGGKSFSRGLPVLIGLAVTLPVLGIVTAVLMDADAVFAMVAGDVLGKVDIGFSEFPLRLMLTVVLTPPCFSLFYFAAHTEQKPKAERAWTGRDSLPAVMLLGALDALYVLFLAVQSAALFGDRSYLVRAGISYAEYARSGFFQLAGLAGFNVAAVLAAVWLCREDRRLKVLSTLLMGLTAVLLVSAGWRMTLYVSAYGLSFKRCLTYWGMGMLAILLVLTVRKVWRRAFRFFRAAAPIALAGWLLLNYANIDGIAARYNVRQVRRGNLSGSAVTALFSDLEGYDGFSTLAEAMDGTDVQVIQRIQRTGERAAEDCGSWVTWSLPAARAAGR